jgi:4-hydroxybenzoate polyprenyltransferase
MGKVADLVFLLRPPLLCASCTFFFAGSISALEWSGRAGLSQVMPEVLPNLGLFVLVVAAAFIVNQLTDIESDRLNRKSFLLPYGLISRTESAVLLICVSALAIWLSFHADKAVRYMVWIGLGLGFAYSVPPVRLKGKPVLDLVANVVGFGVVGFAMGWMAQAGMVPELWLRCVPYALAMSGIFLNTCIPDEEVDRIIGDRTSCVVFGARRVGLAMTVLLAASVITGALAETTWHPGTLQSNNRSGLRSSRRLQSSHISS